jgi:hypothetical protein
VSRVLVLKTGGTGGCGGAGGAGGSGGILPPPPDCVLFNSLTNWMDVCCEGEGLGTKESVVCIHMRACFTFVCVFVCLKPQAVEEVVVPR